MTQPRSHYQKHDGNMSLMRRPIASQANCDKLKMIAYQADRARLSTSQAAYDLRVSQLKSLLKSL